jgi:hypothetical protein
MPGCLKKLYREAIGYCQFLQETDKENPQNPVNPVKQKNIIESIQL